MRKKNGIEGKIKDSQIEKNLELGLGLVPRKGGNNDRGTS